MGHDRTYRDKAGVRWKYSTLKDEVYYKEQGSWRQVRFPSNKQGQANYIRGIQDNGQGGVWIATDHQGLYLYDKATGHLSNYRHQQGDATTLAEDNINTIFVDSTGTLWVGHEKKGLSYHKPSAGAAFMKYESPLWRNISAMVEDHRGNLWIGTDGFGLVCKQPYSDKTINRVAIPGNIVVSLMEDHRGRIWIGTYLHGLLCYDNGTTKTYTKENSRLSDNSVYSLCEDSTGSIWVGTLWGCLQRFDPKTDTWTDYPSQSKDERTAMCFLYDGGDTLYAGMLSGLCRFNIKTGEQALLHGNYHGKSFLQNDIQSLWRDSRGLLWIGHSKGVSVWDTKTDSLRYLTTANGLCDDVIRGIAEDKIGRVWITTSNGCSAITVLQTDDLSFTVENYFQNDGLIDNNQSRHSVLCLPNGDVILGSADGYSVACLGQGVERDRQQPSPLGFIATAVAMTALVSIGIAGAIRDSRKRKRERQQAAREGLITPSELEITSFDEQLLQKAIRTVESNLLNDLTVEDLALAVGLTRGHLYKKLMTITGKGPADFIRTIRLKRARQLLDESGMQIAEIAYAVGYSSPKIFSRNFKAEFGMTPTEYLKIKGNDTSGDPT